MIDSSAAILHAPRGTIEEARRFVRDHFVANPESLDNYLVEVFRLAPFVGVDPALIVAQSAEETSNWTSGWWAERLNPAGIGITGDPAEDEASHTWRNGTEAARSHLAHLLIYAKGSPAAEEAWWDATNLTLAGSDPRYNAYHGAYGIRAAATTLAELTGKWAVDPRYGEQIAAKLNVIFGGTAMPETFSTVVPGLPGGPLVTDYPIHVDIIGLGAQRPGYKAHHPRRSIQHGNGNPDSSAIGERNFLHGLAGTNQAVSYHYTNDDKEVYVLVPLDEVTWQAADGQGPGNYSGFSCEQVEDSDLWASMDRRSRAIHISADLMGRTAARFDGAIIPERHWDFNWVECCNHPCDVQCGNRHHCPDKLMSVPGAWNSYVQQWTKSKADELARMAGTTPPPKPTKWAPKHPPPFDENGKPSDHYSHGEFWFAVNQFRRTIAPVEPLEWADASARPTGPTVPKGKRVKVAYLIRADDGSSWFVGWGGSRMSVRGFVE